MRPLPLHLCLHPQCLGDLAQSLHLLRGIRLPSHHAGNSFGNSNLLSGGTGAHLGEEFTECIIPVQGLITDPHV